MRYETNDITAKKDLAVRFLYNTPPGRTLLKLLVRVYVSKLAGAALNSPASRVFIKRYVNRNRINLNEYKKVRYKSFNDFFIREIKQGSRPISDDSFDLFAPCDGKLTAYPITEGSTFRIKNSVYDLTGMLKNEELSGEYLGGVCMIFRLTPDDYHRYIFFDDGKILAHKKINGELHTVRPIAHGRYKVFSQNAREYTVMQTSKFGKVVQIEVGAMFVGKINNIRTSGAFMRGEEKGMFEFGGSTVILLFKKGAVILDDDIYKNTRADLETIVRLGSTIGRSGA